jgi:hypothetical protein
MEISTGSANSRAKKIKLFSGPGTRRWSRFNISDVPAIRDVCSSAASKIKIANISREGALLRTRKHLATRTRIPLNLVTAEGVIALTGFVLRSSVSSPKGIPRYQAAVVFDRPLQILDDPMGPKTDTSQAPMLKFPPLDMYPSKSADSLYKPIRDGDSTVLAVLLALSVCNAQDATLHELLKLNDW